MIIVSVAEAQVGNYKFGDGYKHLASGLVCGLSSLVSAEALFPIKQEDSVAINHLRQNNF